MASTCERSFVKGVSWEFISFVITVIAVYYFYGDFYISVKFSLALSVVKIFFFFFHERSWKKIRWGKYHWDEKKKKVKK